MKLTKAQVSKIAAPVVTAITAAETAQTKVGDAVLAAATKLDKASIKPFCAAIKAALEKKNFTPGSVKATLTYIRRVVTAVVVDGVELKPGQSLRGLYASLPKKATGGATHAPRLPTGKPDTAPAAATSAPAAATSAPAAATSAVETADKFKEAVVTLFGEYDADLLAAVQYAAANVPIFVKWAHASAAAAAALAEKPAAKKRKAVVTA